MIVFVKLITFTSNPEPHLKHLLFRGHFVKTYNKVCRLSQAGGRLVFWHQGTDVAFLKLCGYIIQLNKQLKR